MLNTSRPLVPLIRLIPRGLLLRVFRLVGLLYKYKISAWIVSFVRLIPRGL